MIKKIIGLLLIFIIIFFAIKAIVFLPYFTNLIIGSSKSPFQIGTEYVDQVNKTYESSSPYLNTDIRYDNGVNGNVVNKVTLEKKAGKLFLSVENANTKQKDLYIWLTNNPAITNETEYVDFGKLYDSVAIRQYVVDMKGGDISLDIFKNILIVDNNNNVYTQISLQ